jgi:hypothetical protein
MLFFIDFIAAFNSVEPDVLWVVLEQDGIPSHLVELLKAYFEGTQMRVRAYGETLPENFAVR